ncbi:TolC family protein [Chitinophaga varians]|uniref:TolC family protein n=1 Tax=Chitinophaga varians TaxID=2202339 RepID=A0A847S7Y0_9BACT|nr:TolC family protein [Chitinophaga varians]NLR68867.1 TolC family protein [Chitinophaga varians]
MNASYRKIVSLSSIVLFTLHAYAQPKPLHIKDMLSLVQSAQPQMKAYAAQAQSTQYGVGLAKNTLLPDINIGYQAGYATYNNVTGMSYPGLILPISGPPVAGNIYDPVPGTAAGAILKWNPLTFGQRSAAVEKASAQYKLANSTYNDALFRQQYAAVATYLDAVYLQKLIQTYQANIDRTKAGLEQSLVFTRQGLRPGIDTTQFQAALAQATTDLLIVQRQYYAQITELTRLTGLPDAPTNILLADTSLLSQLPLIADTTAGPAGNPVYQYYQMRKEVTASALKEVERIWRPKLDLWANAYARGSGVKADGTIDKADGWSLSHKNYGAGIQLSFPILQFSEVHLKKKQYQAMVKADEAQLDQVALNLQKQKEAARYNYSQNMLITKQAVVQSQAARFAFDGLQLSYNSGLIDFTRLIQGQYDLLKAETGEAAAFLQAWRSLLDIAVANGQLTTFTDNLK